MDILRWPTQFLTGRVLTMFHLCCRFDRISDKEEKLVRSRDVSPSQGLLQSVKKPLRGRNVSRSHQFLVFVWYSTSFSSSEPADLMQWYCQKIEETFSPKCPSWDGPSISTTQTNQRLQQWRSAWYSCVFSPDGFWASDHSWNDNFLRQMFSSLFSSSLFGCPQNTELPMPPTANFLFYFWPIFLSLSSLRSDTRASVPRHRQNFPPIPEHQSQQQTGQRYHSLSLFSHLNCLSWQNACSLWYSFQ